MAGFGFDGEIVTRHHTSRMSRIGVVRPTHRAAYVEPILRSSFSYRFPNINVRIADPGAEETLVGTTVFLFNLPRYALGLPFAPEAREDDGLLDLVVFREPGPFQALYYLWRVFCRSHLRHPSVFHRRVKKVVVTVQDAVPVQLDGDPGGFVLSAGSSASDNGRIGAQSPGSDGSDGQTPTAMTTQTAREWTVEILPAALRVMAVPARSHHTAATSARQRPLRTLG
jgi:diacylglycerol kinase family enzyme